jgi:predicted GH43/DUF377 family glycosyl hydrolase
MTSPEHGIHFLTTADLLPDPWRNALADGPVRAFNPGLAADGSNGWLMAYRIVGADGRRRIGICRLSASLQVEPGSARPLSDSFRLRPGSMYPAEAYTWFADPRLFRLGGRLFVYWNSGWHEPRNHQFVQEIDPGTLAAVGHAHELLLDGTRQKLEKNWTLFEHEGHALAVYSIQPHRVLTFDANASGDWLMSEVASTTWPAPPYPACHGGLRGGTPPVRHAGHFWSFCHSVHDAPEGYRYAAAAYTFQAEAPFRPAAGPSQILSLAPSPLPPRSFPKLNPAVGEVVYPCGAARTANGWLISFGLNDERCGLSLVSDADVAATLQPVS